MNRKIYDKFFFESSIAFLSKHKKVRCSFCMGGVCLWRYCQILSAASTWPSWWLYVQYICHEADSYATYKLVALELSTVNCVLHLQNVTFSIYPVKLIAVVVVHVVRAQASLPVKCQREKCWFRTTIFACVEFWTSRPECWRSCRGVFNLWLNRFRSGPY